MKKLIFYAVASLMAVVPVVADYGMMDETNYSGCGGMAWGHNGLMGLFMWF